MSFILSKEDVNNSLHPNLWYDILEAFDIDPGAEEIAIRASYSDTEKFFLLSKKDLNNPLHPDIWENLLESLGFDTDLEEIFIVKSALDTNKVKN